MDTQVLDVAIYTRISPNPKKADTENQEIQLTEFANRQGWRIVEVYREIHVSGGKKGEDRIQFKRMMLDASKRKFGLLLFWALDRLSREGVYETLQYLRQLTNYGIDYRSYTEPFFDSCGIFKDAVIAIMATLAKQERIKLVDRTRAGLENARRKGVVLGRRRAKIDYHAARTMRESGATLKDISAKFKVSESVVCRLLKVGV